MQAVRNSCQSCMEFFSSRRELSNPRRELSNPRRELSNPRRELSNPRRELKNSMHGLEVFAGRKSKETGSIHLLSNEQV